FLTLEIKLSGKRFTRAWLIFRIDASRVQRQLAVHPSVIFIKCAFFTFSKCYALRVVKEAYTDITAWLSAVFIVFRSDVRPSISRSACSFDSRNQTFIALGCITVI